jgi:hypothetical protein
MAVSRLVARGYLRAVYFPKPPEIEGVSVGDDDPTWLKLLGWFGKWTNSLAFPKVCYVSFADVVELWMRGDAKERCQPKWRELIVKLRSKRESVRQFHEDLVFTAELESAEAVAKQYKLEDRKTGNLASTKLFLHDELLERITRLADEVKLTRNQLIFWIMQQWLSRLERDGTDMDCPPRLPTAGEVDRIQHTLKVKAHEHCRSIPCRYIHLIDELGGDLGVLKGFPVGLDGGVD